MVIIMNHHYSFDNFNIDLNVSSFQIIIWGIYIGILLGTLGSVLFRVYSSKIIKALVANGASDESSAKTLSELGLLKTPFVRMYLKDDSVIRRSVLVCGSSHKKSSANKFKIFWYESFIRTDIPKVIDFENAKFYLPEENRAGAELRFKEEAHPVRSFILAAVIMLAAALFAIYALPELLSMFDNFITQVKPESKYY